MVHQHENHQNKKKGHGKRQGKRYPPRKGNPKLYQERNQNKTCYFYSKPGHMIAECRSRIHQEKVGKCTRSTVLEDSFENFMETLSLNCKKLTHMTAELKIGGKMARTFLDIGTVGTNLMSLNWAQSN